MTSPRRGWLWPAMGGVLLGLSYFPGPSLALNLAAFLPLLAWLDVNAEATALQRFKAGLLFGLLAELVMLHFMYAMLEWSWLAVLLYLGMSLAVGIRIALAVLLLGWLRRRTELAWVVLLPLAWIPAEWAQSFGDLRMTGDLLAHSVAGYAFLIQFADLVGPYGVGAVLLVLNALLYETVARRGTRAGRSAAAGLALVALAVVAYDGWTWSLPEPEGRTIRVGIVQPNIPLLVKRGDEMIGEQAQKLADQSREAASRGAELIVWPETARPLPLLHWLERPETRALPEVQSLARSLGRPLLVGVEYYRIRGQDDYDLFNAAMAVDEEGRLLDDWGAKVYLVPFVEALPFRRLFGPLVEGRGGEWHWVSGGFESGPRSAVIEIAGTRVGVLVCFEEFFPSLARDLHNAGAELQIVISNDAWFGRTLFQPYMVNALRLRAIENRTSYVRAANTGISAFIDSRGRVHERTALFEEAVEVHEITLATGRTIYNRTGELVVWLCLAGLAVVAAPRVRWRIRGATLLVPLLVAFAGCDTGRGAKDEAVGPPERARSPNLLVMVADDLGRSFVGAHGSRGAPTPNIDRLAAEGFRFDRAFTPTALCRPSRWAIYTGLQPHQSGVRGFNRVSREVSLLHEVLHDQGYRTGLLAKFGSKVQEFKPFDFFVGNPELDGGQDVAGVAAAASRFFDGPDDGPFFLLVGFGDAHAPYPETPFGSPDEVHVPPYLPDLPEIRREITLYNAAVGRLDRGVGLVLDALEVAGHADDTLVVFTSDHGPAFPFAKSTLYDAGVAVPLIVRWPGRTAERGTATELISFVDIRPTLLQAASIADPAPGAGRSFLPLLLGQAFDGRDALFLSHTANFEGEYPMRGIRTADYKYIRNFEPRREFVARLERQAIWNAMLEAAGTDPAVARRVAKYAKRPPEELYVLASDSAELDNRIDDPRLATELERLRARLRTTMKELGDPLLEATPDP